MTPRVNVTPTKAERWSHSTPRQPFGSATRHNFASISKALGVIDSFGDTLANTPSVRETRAQLGNQSRFDRIAAMPGNFDQGS